MAAIEIIGAGSSAAAPLYAAWGEAWGALANSKLNYLAIGSSGGIKSILEGKSDFGASDVALSREQLEKDGLANFPVAISGVVPMINLPGVPRGQLKVTGSLLADIFGGRVTQWNAPEIAALNRGLALPNLPIKLIAREDGSGTTYVLSYYLKTVNDNWAQSMGNDFKLKWPATVQLAKGTGGVIEAVKRTVGGISYAEYGQVEQAALNYVRVANQKGQYPAPGPASFKAALEGSAWVTRGAYEEMLTDAPSISAWPITSSTFVIMRRHVARADQASAILSMLSYGFMKGDEAAARLNWIPLPASTQARVEREMLKLVNKDGKPLSWQISY